MTLWQGRFGAEPAEELIAFTSSLGFDLRLVSKGDDRALIDCRARRLRG